MPIKVDNTGLDIEDLSPYWLSNGTSTCTGDWDLGEYDLTTTGTIQADSDSNGLKLGDDQDMLLYSDGAGVLYIKPTAADTDTTVNFFGTTNSGQLKWMEDEDYFDFTDKVKFSDYIGIKTAPTATNPIAMSDTYAGNLDLVFDNLSTSGSMRLIFGKGAGYRAYFGAYSSNYITVAWRNTAAMQADSGLTGGFMFNAYGNIQFNTRGGSKKVYFGDWQYGSNVFEIYTDTGNTQMDGNLTIGAGAAGTDYTLTFDGETNNGVLTWMEDEDYFQFSDDIYLVGGENIILSTSTGTKIGTATNQLLGFYNATPVDQPGNTEDIKDALISLGLIASGGATNLNLDGGSFTGLNFNVVSGEVNFNGATSYHTDYWISETEDPPYSAFYFYSKPDFSTYSIVHVDDITYHTPTTTKTPDEIYNAFPASATLLKGGKLDKAKLLEGEVNSSESPRGMVEGLSGGKIMMNDRIMISKMKEEIEKLKSEVAMLKSR